MSTINGGWRGPNIVQDGLVLYLDAASPTSYNTFISPTTWRDLSGNENNTTLTNGPTFSSVNGGSITFDNVDDYCITTLNTTPTLNITSQITLDTWITPTALASSLHADGIISKGVSADGNAAIYELLLAPSASINYPYFRLRLATTTVYWPTNIPINLNVPSSIICTYDQAMMRIYVNGVESGTGLSANGNIATNTQQLALGTRFNNIGTSNATFSGNMSQVRIYNRALSSTEISQNFNATRTRFGV